MKWDGEWLFLQTTSRSARFCALSRDDEGVNFEVDPFKGITEMSATANDVAHNTNRVALTTEDASDYVLKAQKCVDISLNEV